MNMEFIKFNSTKQSKIEYLYDTVDDTLSIMDFHGNVYHNCTIGWEQGRTRSVVFDNYRFYHHGNTIWPEYVEFIAIEDDSKDDFIQEYEETE